MTLETTIENKFQPVFMYFVASAKGFVYCRLLLRLDGTHLKSKYQGINESIIVLAATSNSFRSSQNQDPTRDRPTFVSSSVRSVWIGRCPIDSPVTTSVGPKKPSVHVSSRSW